MTRVFPPPGLPSGRPRVFSPAMLPPDVTEPAVRDPKKLRRTAWILVGIMVIGGFLILKAYEIVAKDQAKDQRPAKIHQIRKERDLRVVRQDGKQADLFDLRGKVWVVQVVSLEQPEVAALGHAVMKSLAAEYRQNDDFRLVTLIVDPPSAGELAEKLQSFARREDIGFPQWWVASTEPKTLHKFIQNELKADEFPRIEDGRWTFDTSLTLIDREGNLRRGVIPGQAGKPVAFDFDEARRLDEGGMKTRSGRSVTEDLNDLLRKSIDTVLSPAPES